MGDADAMITGVTLEIIRLLEQVTTVIDPMPERRMIGLTMMVARGRTVLVADTNVHDMPNSEELADITESAAHAARALGYEPRGLAGLFCFWAPEGDRSVYVREAVKMLRRQVDFEFDGDMAADVALNKEARALYPFNTQRKCKCFGDASHFRGFHFNKNASKSWRRDHDWAHAGWAFQAGANCSDWGDLFRIAKHGGYCGP